MKRIRKNIFIILFLFISMAFSRHVSLSVSKPDLDSTYRFKADYWMEKGYESLKNKQFDLAIGYYSKALEINSNLTTAYYNRGLSWDHKGDLERAFNDYTKVLEIDPRNYKTYNNRGFVLLRQEKFDQAILDFNKAIEIDPRSYKAFNNRGICYHKNGKYDQAIADFTRGLQINSHFLDLYINRGTVFSEIDAYDQAILDLSKAIEISPANAEAFFKRAVAYGNNGDFYSAIDDYSKLLEKFPNHPGILNNRGVAWKKTGNIKKAKADYNKCIEYNNIAAVACHNSLAWLLATCPDIKCRDGRQALELAKDLVKIRPNAYHLGTLAAAYAEVGKFGDAINAINTAIIMLKENGTKEELAEFEKQLDSYKSNRPWREK